MSARNPDESGGDSLRVPCVLSDTFDIGSLQTEHSRKDIGVSETHLAECRTPSAHGFVA